MERETEFPPSAGHRLIKNSTDRRVSPEAGRVLVEQIEDYGKMIAEKAQMLADHAGRKTIQPEDVKQAIHEV